MYVSCVRITPIYLIPRTVKENDKVETFYKCIQETSRFANSKVRTRHLWTKTNVQEFIDKVNVGRLKERRVFTLSRYSDLLLLWFSRSYSKAHRIVYYTYLCHRDYITPKETHPDTFPTRSFAFACRWNELTFTQCLFQFHTHIILCSIYQRIDKQKKMSSK